MDKFELELEKKRLASTLLVIGEVLKEENDSIDSLYKNYIGSRDSLWALVAKKKAHIKALETSLDKPYFARIDIVLEETGEEKTLYIGKNGIMRGNEIFVTDWRAPVSSIYYDYDIGECDFRTPDGLVNARLNLKRQFEIERGSLLEYFDVDLVTNDGLLQRYLNSNNDTRLHSIVATIQKEQNDVIRRTLFQNLIIQGVAGSGKTTVALHRIAFLVYNYINTIKQNGYLVIGPNDVFLRYIKSVLPDLDVSSVNQCTYENFVINYIGEKVNINSSFEKTNNRIERNLKDNIDKFKCSMRYKEMLDLFLEDFYDSLVSKDLTIDDFIIVSKDIMKKIFDESRSKSSNGLSTAIEMAILKIGYFIDENKDDILHRFLDYSSILFQNASTVSDKEKLRKKFAKCRDEINKNCLSILRKYFSKIKLSPMMIYKSFISSIENYNIFDFNDINTLKKITMSNIRKNVYDFEDLAALLYIKLCIAPLRKFSEIKHTVIDEAQDLGEFNFYTLRMSLTDSTFSIFGDLAQSIYDYRSIDSWSDVNRIMFDGKGKLVEFRKSYRTTAEIMSIADSVSDYIGLGSSDFVVRHGSEVSFSDVPEGKQIEHIVNKIKEFLAKGYKTVAIISKTDSLSKYINQKLSLQHINIPNITIDDDLSDEKLKVCTISNQLAKGLEFDAVIISNASEGIYLSDSVLDMKLLYVAITRALHELDIVYEKELPKPLTRIRKR